MVRILILALKLVFRKNYSLFNFNFFGFFIVQYLQSYINYYYKHKIEIFVT